LVPIARNKADNDVVIGNVVNNEAETAKNQAPNLEVLLATQTAIERMRKDTPWGNVLTNKQLL
jgi:hypothetical protein